MLKLVTVLFICSLFVHGMPTVEEYEYNPYAQEAAGEEYEYNPHAQDVDDCWNGPDSEQESAELVQEEEQPFPVLREGARGRAVKGLQWLLKSKGFLRGQTPTQYFGTVTKAAVQSFQRSRGLTSDGVVGRQTFAMLIQHLIAKKQRGFQSYANKAVQCLLGLTEDGYFGSGTEQKLRAATGSSIASGGVWTRLFSLENGGVVSRPRPTITVTPRPVVSIKPSVSNQGWPVLKQISNFQVVEDFRVTALQFLLTGKGLLPATGNPDGLFGQGTEDAVKKFQSQNGLSTSGVVDGPTWSKLTEQPACKATQAALLYINEYLLVLDGDCGSGTHNAVKTVQRQAGLQQTGKVDSATFKAMLSGTYADPGRCTNCVCPIGSGKRVVFQHDWGNPRPGGRTHKATDVNCKVGDPIVATESGVVQRMAYHSACGNGLFLKADSGRAWYHCHLSGYIKNTGDHVNVGEPIALCGNTGGSSAPHLHVVVQTTNANWDSTKMRDPYAILQRVCNNQRDPPFKFY